jgi:hypothetical protein
VNKPSPRPERDAGESLPHDEARDGRQPYAAEHEDYHDGVAKPPKETAARTGRTKKQSDVKKNDRT